MLNKLYLTIYARLDTVTNTTKANIIADNNEDPDSLIKLTKRKYFIIKLLYHNTDYPI
ncbi:hypothetical protein F7308_0329 [Francisella salina]|uniref:Uncharacterized protein n=1 Tax=Francisella salina TaxID=573569 RepID=A0ABM5M7W4_FRAST|nr:hypothetical protein F7308_0329 [Francisella salina]